MQSKPGAIIIEGHIQALSITRSLGDEGIPVIVVDKSNCITRYSKHCYKFFKCPPFTSNRLADFLIELAELEKLNGWLIFPTNDHAVHTISRNKQRLKDYYKVITPELEIIDNIYDKSLLLGIAERAGVSIPKTYFATDIDTGFNDFCFPVLTKGRQGLDFYKATGKKAFLANDQHQLYQQLNNIVKLFPLEQLFTQELIPYNGHNKTISVAVFCNNGVIKTMWAGEKLREHPIRFGTATCARSISCEGFFEPTKRLMKALNYTGVCEVEYLLDPRDNQYKLIEINARTWLWIELAKACGVNFAMYIYEFMHEKEIDFPETYITGPVWINHLTDIPFSIAALFKSKLNFREYFLTLRAKQIDAIINGKDLRPFFAYFLMLPFFKFRR